MYFIQKGVDSLLESSYQYEDVKKCNVLKCIIDVLLLAKRSLAFVDHHSDWLRSKQWTFTCLIELVW